MPLTALNDDGGRLTARDFTVESWDAMRGQRRNRQGFYCPWCHSSMHPKRLNSTGTPFFSHDAGANCSHPPETAAHLAIKDGLVVSINSVRGWHASTEEPASLEDGTRYVADVVAHPDDEATGARKPWVYEVQLSPQTEDDTERRHNERVQGHGRCVWMTQRRYEWSDRYPACVVSSEDHSLVIDGIYSTMEDKAPPMPLATLVRDFHTAPGLVWVDGVGFIPQGAWVPNYRRPERRRRRLPETPGTVADFCDREPMPGLGPAMFVADWTEDHWFGRARMAQVRAKSGAPLDDIDKEALRRWPHPIRMSEQPPSMLRRQSLNN